MDVGFWMGEGESGCGGEGGMDFELWMLDFGWERKRSLWRGKAMRPGVFRAPFVEPLSGRVVGDEVVPHLFGEEDEVFLPVADDPMAVFHRCLRAETPQPGTMR